MAIQPQAANLGTCHNFFLTVNKLILAVPCHQERVGGVKIEQEWVSERREK